ncbi:MAG: N-acetyl-gamma-glutamyl-phosphate reductase [Verrucomicrobiae bacterium]|nr:N-acetyl-gamma-glutamyl-phosphate reductase [Verrucomicrobiae bacterium]
MEKKKVAIVGASGYSGEELINLLLRHQEIELVAVTSRQYEGKTIAEVHPRFANFQTAKRLKFTNPQPETLAELAETIFLALPHGVAASYAVPIINAGKKVIDLSADFRLKNPQTYKEFYGHDHPSPDLLKISVYGLPEIYKEQIKTASLIASPGCYPTSILLPTIPLLKKKIIEPSQIIVNSLSGVSGAGRKAELDYLFCECNESLRAYGIPKHRHLSEIEEQLSFAAQKEVIAQFTPHLVPVNRGILTTICLTPSQDYSGADAAALNSAIENAYSEFYSSSIFIRVLGNKSLPDTKHVVGTNVIEFGWKIDPRTKRIILVSAIDNLVKGAGGQAVQSMNLIYGFKETEGLSL